VAIFEFLLAAAFAQAASPAAPPSVPAASTAFLAYPSAAAAPVSDDYHGVKVSDPYRWLEADIRTSPRVRDWVAAENKLSRTYLDAIPQRGAILRRLDALSNIEAVSAPIVAGGKQFFYRRGPGEEQSSYWLRAGEGGPARKLLDPVRWSADSSSALAAVAVERRGRLVAYAVQDAGSDWRTWHVVDAASGRDLPDAIRWNKFSDAFWDRDGSGLYYTRFPEPQAGSEYSAGNSGEQLYYHRLGAPQSADRLVYEDKANSDYMFIGSLSEDGRYLIINTGYNGGGATILYKDLRGTGGFVPLFPENADGLTSNRFVGARGSTLYFLSTAEAPNGRLIAVDLSRPGTRPTTLIEQSRYPLVAISYAGRRFFAQYLEDAKARVHVFDERGGPVGEVALPGPGTARGFTGRHDVRSVYFDYASFATPFSVYRYDIASGRTSLVLRPQGPVDPSLYQIDQVFFTARDGKRIPMFLAYRKGLTRTGETPTLLYGYGGFNLSFPPDFRPEQVGWMDMGGIFAFPALPGGGEYGDAWHAAGMLERKPAVFDAFVDAAQYLIDQGYTKPSRLAILGYSNGGLLIGAVVAKRPDLFAVAFPTVGVLDMLRFPQFTNGRLWEVEYGDPQDPAMFPVLRGYSPYHNIVPGRRYPAMLIGTGDTDDRVAPAHSFKYAARMQAEGAPDNPVLLEVETKAGHGAGTSRSHVVAAAADRLAFALKNLGFELPADFPAGQPAANDNLPRGHAK
jgi:prolyl oligopeptidase